MTPFAGVQGTAGDADGPRTDATFWDIQGITSDAQNLYLGVYKDNGLPADSEGWIRKIDMTTGDVSTLVHEAGFVPRKLAYADGKLYVASPADTTLQTVDLSTAPVTMSSFGPTVQSAEAIATDGTNLYVAEMGPDCGDGSPDGPKITKIPIDDPGSSTTLATFSKDGSGCNTMYELTYGNGSLYATDRSTLYEIDPDTGEVSVVMTECSPGVQLNFPYGLAVLNGVAYVSCSQLGGELWAVNLATGEKFSAFAGTDSQDAAPRMGIGLDTSWHPAAIAPFDGKLYIADRLDYDPEGLGWAHHMLRQAEILPDAAPPTGTATATATEGTTMHRAPHRAASTYKLKIAASDQKTGRIPSGVRWFQIGQHGAATSGWTKYTTSATMALPPNPQIRFRDRAFNVSSWTAVKVPTLPRNTVAPSISGTPKVGRTLTCNKGTWSGTTPIAYGYSWLRGGSPVAGATSASYVARAADRGKLVSCRVTAHNTVGGTSKTSAAVKIN